jgi:Copper type II ascorbate-dependent monooxygenase, C-terminal domain
MRVPTAVSLLFVVGCGSSSVSPGPAPDDADGGGSTGGPAPASFGLTFGPLTVAPGVERTQCITVRLHNPDRLHVGTIHNTLGSASHHMIVYRVSDTIERTTPYDCQPFTDTLDPAKGSPLMITQKKDDILTLPAGVAYSIAANQMLRLEMHYLNPGAAPVELKATSTFVAIADADFRDEADFLFIGNPDIALPPNATTTLGPSFFKLPATYSDVKFFALTGHEHHLGTSVAVSVAAGPTDPGKVVYDVPGWNWAEPKTVSFPTPFTVDAGSGFRFSCTWNNTTDKKVSFGESANDEMCFFWAYYYPSKGAKVCFHTERLGAGDACCPGSSLCALVGN